MSGGNGGGYKGGGNMGAPKMFAGGAPGNFNMQPQTGGLEPMLPPSLAGTGGVKSPYGPYGPPGFIPDAPAGAGNPQGLTQQMPLTPNNPAWFNSPQGMAAQWQAGVGNSPLSGLGPNAGQYPGGPMRGNGGPSGQRPMSPADAIRQTPGALNAAMAGQPKTWYQKELAAAGQPWQGMNDQQQINAYLNTLPPEQKQEYLAKMQGIGLSAPFAGTPPFGS